MYGDFVSVGREWPRALIIATHTAPTITVGAHLRRYCQWGRAPPPAAAARPASAQGRTAPTRAPAHHIYGTEAFVE